MAAAAAQLLGEDGRGYELARRLEACGAWREWLGDDSAHPALAQHLKSPATWDAFLYPAASPSPPPRPLLLLQLRVRALLLDKASAALLLPQCPHAARPQAASIPSTLTMCDFMEMIFILWSLWKISRKITLNIKLGSLADLLATLSQSWGGHLLKFSSSFWSDGVQLFLNDKQLKAKQTIVVWNDATTIIILVCSLLIAMSNIFAIPPALEKDAY